MPSKEKHMLIVAKRRKEGQRIKLMDAKSAFSGFSPSLSFETLKVEREKSSDNLKRCACSVFV